MGRILSFDEWKGRRPPTRTDFLAEVEALKELVRDRRDTFVGGILYGSAATGACGARSDIDALVLVRDTREDEALRLLGWSENRHLLVPRQLVILTQERAGMAEFALGPGLHDHVQRYGVPFGGAVLQHLARPTQNVVQEAVGTCRTLRRQLTQAATGKQPTETELIALLDKALNGPFHVARRFIHHETGKNVSAKAEVLRAAEKTLPVLAGPLQTLATADKRYADAILVGGKGFTLRRSNMDRRGYKKLLLACWNDAFPAARKFADLCESIT